MMTFALTSRCLRLLLQILLGGLFLYAGASKLSSPQHLADSIASFQLLPIVLISPFALSLPLFELAVGVLLITGWRVRAASLGALGMIAVFTIALTIAVVRGLPIECGCFGSNKVSTYGVWLLLMRDGLVGAMSFVLFWQTCSVETNASTLEDITL